MGSRDYLDVFRDPARDRYSGGVRVSATYRIEIKRDDDETLFPWQAVITRLADDWPVRVERERTADHALESARQWIYDENRMDETPAYFHVDDQGRDAEAPQSVKV